MYDKLIQTGFYLVTFSKSSGNWKLHKMGEADGTHFHGKYEWNNFVKKFAND